MRFIGDNSRYAKIKQVKFNRFYSYLSEKYYDVDEYIIMNYGFDGDYDVPAELKTYKYNVQLYQYLLDKSELNFKNKKILEVGSGRGGGSYYVYHTAHPSEMVGLDRCVAFTKFSNERFAGGGLKYITGDAELLPYNDRSFDIIMNVESSHCYANLSQFLAEVNRVLIADGTFLFSDFRPNDEIEGLQNELNLHFDELFFKDITQEVLSAAEKGNYFDIARKYIDKKDTDLIREWTGAVGSDIYLNFKNGLYTYFAYILRKKPVQPV